MLTRFTTRLAGTPVDWYKSQAETSCTYGGAWAGYLTGGLNFQIEVGRRVVKRVSMQ